MPQGKQGIEWLQTSARNPISDSLLPWWPFTSPNLITDMEGDFIVLPNKYFHTFIVATSTMDVVGLKGKERKKEI